ncbi:MAG: DUF1624 domain-containing protein [Phycisphaerae bacterium]|nr:DUF1624 domain-containing protein [Phycisphaerae bacterium]
MARPAALPPPRIAFLDLARGLAIFFMIMQHAMLIYGIKEGRSSPLGMIVLLSGTGPAAPVFMLIMGVFFVRPKTAGLRYGLVRGLKLIALGYLLNLLRFSIPVLIRARSGLGTDDINLALSHFFAVDILQMAGLSLMIMAIIRQYAPRPLIWLALAAAVALVSPLLWGRFQDYPPLALLWGKGTYVYFPLFPWVIYPLVGMFYSRFLTPGRDLRPVMKRTALVGVGILVVGVVAWVLLLHTIYGVGDYHRNNLGDHLLTLGFVFVWLPFWWWVVEKLPGIPLFRLLYYWSRHVTAVYFIQWVLIGWSVFIVGPDERPPTMAVLIGLAVCALSDLLTRAYVAIRTAVPRASRP